MLTGQGDKWKYNRYLRKYAHENRSQMTKAECCLWKYVLRNRKMLGYQFRRQRPVLNYIADFMCKELFLIIEVDGLGHQWEEVARNDILRTAELEKAGFTVIRFTNREVLENIKYVSAEIERVIIQIYARIGFIPPPGPRQRGNNK